MKKMLLRKRKVNNRGMSLIEILIAMTLLSVAIIPLMYCFVNIARFSAKGRALQHTSVMAQTVMENCKAYTMEEIQQKVIYGNFLNGSYASGASYACVNDSTTGELQEVFITNLKVDNKVYGIDLKFTPIASAERVSSYIEDMNPVLDGVFIAETTLGTLAGTSTTMTAEDFEEYAFTQVFQWVVAQVETKSTEAGGPIVHLSTDDVYNSFFSGGSNSLKATRNITIAASGSGANDKATVEYVYTFQLNGGANTYKYVAPDATETVYAIGAPSSYTLEFEIYDVADNEAQLENIYFFYYPAYSNATYTTYPCVSDSIAVSNMLTHDYDTTATAEDIKANNLNVFLIKQMNPDMTDISIELAETNYMPTVKTVTSSNPVNLYHNLDVNIGGTGVMGWNTSYLSGSVYPDSLDREETIQYMYEVDVIIYENASCDGSSMTGTEVLRMDGTKTNW